MEKRLLVSGYSTEDGPDIALVRFSQGRFKTLAVHRQGDGPSFLLPGTDGFYACSENERDAALYLYRMEGDRIIPVRSLRFPGRLACHLSRLGDAVVTACYGSGTITGVDGSCRTIRFSYDTAERNAASTHAHWTAASPFGPFLYAVDLGEDTISSYPVGPDGALGTAVKSYVPAGRGPRQILFDRARRLCYVVAERGHTLGVYRPNATDGRLEMLHEYPTVLTGGACLACGAVQAEDGRVYVANRGPNTLTVFEPSGDVELRRIGEAPSGGSWPRYLAFLGGNRLLVTNQKSGLLCCFATDGPLPVPLGAYRHPLVSWVGVVD